MRAVSVASDLFDFSIHFIFLLIISLINFLFLLPDTFNFHDVVDNYTLRTSAEDLGTLAENEPPTFLPWCLQANSSRCYSSLMCGTDARRDMVMVPGNSVVVAALSVEISG